MRPILLTRFTPSANSTLTIPLALSPVLMGRLACMVFKYDTRLENSHDHPALEVCNCDDVYGVQHDGGRALHQPRFLSRRDAATAAAKPQRAGARNAERHCKRAESAGHAAGADESILRPIPASPLGE